MSAPGPASTPDISAIANMNRNNKAITPPAPQRFYPDFDNCHFPSKEGQIKGEEAKPFLPSDDFTKTPISDTVQVGKLPLISLWSVGQAAFDLCGNIILIVVTSYDDSDDECDSCADGCEYFALPYLTCPEHLNDRLPIQLITTRPRAHLHLEMGWIADGEIIIKQSLNQPVYSNPAHHSLRVHTPPIDQPQQPLCPSRALTTELTPSTRPWTATTTTTAAPSTPASSAGWWTLLGGC